MRLALYCATGQKVKLLEKKSYFVDFEVGHTLGGGRFSLKEIKTFEDEADNERKGGEVIWIIANVKKDLLSVILLFTLKYIKSSFSIIKVSEIINPTIKCRKMSF